MAEQQTAARGPATDDAYRIMGVERILTPSLALYPESLDANVETTLRLLGGDANRWRPHVKTAKLAFTMQRLVRHGIRQFKCATTLELMTACEAGAEDVLLAYPVRGAGAQRVRELAQRFRATHVSVLVDHPEQVGAWSGGTVGVFIDINSGMNRTGIEQDRKNDIIRVARAIENAGLIFRGLHYYDGHLGRLALAEREVEAHRGYDRLMAIVAAMEQSGISVPEVVTSGTPALPCALSFPGFAGPSFVHRVSPGTVVYADCQTLAELPSEYGYRPAVLVVSSVVSRPMAGRITCDAGSKAASADVGVPTCAVLGRPDLQPLTPSEEHLPIEVPPGSPVPALGDVLYLVPMHVCTTVNNFDHAVIVAGGRIVGVERVTARGRESPLLEENIMPGARLDR